MEQVKFTDLLQPRSHRRGCRRGSQWGLPHDADEGARGEETSAGSNAADTAWTWVGSWIFQISLFRKQEKGSGLEELVSHCGAVVRPLESLLPVGLLPALSVCHRAIFTFSQPRFREGKDLLWNHIVRKIQSTGRNLGFMAIVINTLSFPPVYLSRQC